MRVESASPGPPAGLPAPTQADSDAESRAPKTGAHRIVIVGGAGGLELAARLGDNLGRRGEALIVLVDAALTHLWKPLLHEVAAGTLTESEQALDYLQQARWHHFGFRFGRFEALERSRRQIWLAAVKDDEGREITPRRVLSYDTLVIAIGAIDNDFGTPGARAHAYSLNSAEEAERFHRRLLALCARAEIAGREPVRVAIVGGGATGVELAAELDCAARIIASYGAQLSRLPQPLAVTLVEAGPRLLPALPEEVAESAHADLIARGIVVRVGERVTGVDAAGIVVAASAPAEEKIAANGGRIDADVVVWAAGIRGQEVLERLDGLPTNRLRQLVVRPTLQSAIDDDVFAIGDCASVDAAPVPPTAQAARQQALLLARSLPRRLRGESLLEFSYRERGSLVSLGGERAVGSFEAWRRDLVIRGLPARLTYWLLYRQHLATLLGLTRTILVTLGQWLARRAQPRVKLH